MRVALLGGSFDPPHLAHLQVVTTLLDKGGFDQIWILPSPQNPLKPTSTAFADRLAMCRLAFEGIDPSISVKDDEGSLSGFTIDLIRHLKTHHPKADFTFIGGSDLKAEIADWKESEALQKMLQFQFLPRPPDPTSPFLPIRARDIRERIKNGLPIDDLVPNSIKAFIKNNGLYWRQR